MQIRAITVQERQHYRQHGVVYLPDFVDADWQRRMVEAYNEEMFGGTEGVNHGDLGEVAKFIEAAGHSTLKQRDAEPTGRFWVKTFNWRTFESVTELGCASDMAGTIADLMGSDRINFYGEQLFFKEAGSLHRTAFHQDAPYFHLTGDQCCTVWMPLDTVDAENGMMGYVRGSHEWGIHAANTFASRMSIPGSRLEQLPDIEADESAFDIVYYPCKPGDAIVHHVRTVHGSTGNTGKRDRRAFTLRYVGDDVRYLEREGTPPDSQKSAELSDGDVLDSADFPLVWIRAEGNVWNSHAN